MIVATNAMIAIPIPTPKDTMKRNMLLLFMFRNSFTISFKPSFKLSTWAKDTGMSDMIEIAINNVLIDLDAKLNSHPILSYNC